MLFHVYLSCFIIFHSIEFSSSLKCYFQRCKNLEGKGWLCNTDEEIVRRTCQPDEVCFEESFEASFGVKSFLRERNCRSGAFIDGKFVYLKPFIDAMRPNGGCMALNYFDISYVIGNVDLCNNKLQMPPSFNLAEMGACIEEYCINDCDPRPCKVRCPKPVRYVYCGSILDWTCRLRIFNRDGKYRWHERACKPIDDLHLVMGTDEENLIVKDQLEETTSNVYLFEDLLETRHVHSWYCRTSLCNDMNVNV